MSETLGATTARDRSIRISRYTTIGRQFTQVQITKAFWHGTGQACFVEFGVVELCGKCQFSRNAARQMTILGHVQN